MAARNINIKIIPGGKLGADLGTPTLEAGAGAGAAEAAEAGVGCNQAAT
jgi:hypothetical protein